MRMVVERLEEGEVISYADVAERAGYPGRHRAAGRLLRHSGDCLPWWRVVYSDGGFPPVDPVRQERNLIAENVEIKDMRVISSPKGRFA
ncbi:MAG: MGMT family protein [Planctomycetota bacterium]